MPDLDLSVCPWPCSAFACQLPQLLALRDVVCFGTLHIKNYCRGCIQCCVCAHMPCCVLRSEHSFEGSILTIHGFRGSNPGCQACAGGQPTGAFKLNLCHRRSCRQPSFNVTKWLLHSSPGFCLLNNGESCYCALEDLTPSSCVL